jgi:hypothetical protein
MARGDASKTADLLAQSGLIQPDRVSAAAKLLEAIEKLKKVTFSSCPNATSLIESLSSIASEARAVLQTREITQVLEEISGLAVVAAYQIRIREMNNEISHLNDLTDSINHQVSQACGALNSAARAKESLISKIQSLKREVEGNQTGR